MRPQIKVRGLLAALSLAALPVSGSAHDFWIEPDNFTPAAGEPVDVRLREGVDFKGNTLPYITEWFSDFSTTTVSGKNDVESMLGDDPAATLIGRNGPLLIGYRSNRSFVELDAAKFNGYLEEEGIEFIREERRKRGEDNDPAPEYFVRCAKALLQTGPVGDDSVFNTTLGYTLELVALDNPYTLVPGSPIRFKLIYRDKPAVNLLVQAFTADDPESRQRLRTDAEGMVTVQLDKPGVWMIKAVNIQPIIGDPKALWQSYWASYVFDLPAANP